MTRTKLIEAIKNKKSISFNYIKEGKDPGIRIGDPHALFIYVSKAGKESVKVHIAQTGGVSDSGTPFPSFRMFDLEDIRINAILTENHPFTINSDYNPYWEGYAQAIEKL